MKNAFLRIGCLILVILLLSACAARPPDSAAVPAPDLSAYPWFYLRDGRSLSADESVVELVAVGDVMLGRGVAETPADPFAAVTSWLAAADLTLGNLEGVIVAGGTARAAPPDGPQPYILHMPTTAADTLRTAGFDLLGQANNHSLDYGAAGLAETAERLQTAGITPFGLGETVLREVDGVRLAFLAFNMVNGEPHPWDVTRATAAVAAARETADAVIVSMHWGYEYHLRADPAQVSAAEAMVAAGADVIVGHHPHVVQGVAAGEQTFVAYSLGNFVFDQAQEETRQGLALRLFVDTQGLRAVQALPLWAGPQPRLMTAAEGAALLRRIAPPPRRVAWVCDGRTCERTAADPLPEQSGRFWAGQIDLTGDGVAETVRLVGEQVTIYEAGAVAWQSPPEWRVLDAALGDPNDDGRYELMLALLRPDPDGHERSQPYMVGHRGGAYQVIWGGRPVTDPIREIEVGDVDGDGVQELVVIETRSDGDAVAVWRWTGWSFGLVWRERDETSLVGRYYDLVLLSADGGRVVISAAVQ